MIEEKELDQIPKCLAEAGLIPKDLIDHLVSRDEDFTILATKRQGTDTFFYEVTVERKENLGLYCLPGYRATVLHVGEIDHIEISGLNTADIEKKFASIDWEHLSPLVLSEDSKQRSAILQLGLLYATHNQKLCDIADLLSLKYLTGTPISMHFTVDDKRKKYESSIFIDLNGNEQDLALDDSFRLLAGRAVTRYLNDNPNQLGWLIKDGDTVRQLPDFDLSGELAKLPFASPKNNASVAQVIMHLSAGKILESRFTISGHTFRGSYYADPRTGSIAVLDKAGKRVDLALLQRDQQALKEFIVKEKVNRKGLGL
ncbi:MAG: hypothetical protein ACN6O7_00660 [Sphingobacterium sp.]